MKPLEDYSEAFCPGWSLIEADAGTGKTHTIVDAVIWLVALGYYSLADFLLITFTRAATNEIHQRLRKRLKEVQLALKEGKDYGGNDRLLVQLGKLDRSQVLQNLEKKGLETTQATVCTIHSFCQQVLHNWPQLCGFDGRSLQSNVEWLLGEIVDDFLVSKGINLEKSNLKREELLKILRKVSRYFRAEVIGKDPLLVEFVEWGKAQIRQRLQRYGMMSFDELLLRLREALEQPKLGDDLASQLRKRYRAVLVDEFQDTDLEQWEIIKRVWLEKNVRRKSDTFLCLVGDPKQSIYGFRNADVFVFAEAKRLIPEERQFTLSLNHRSDGRLVEALNRLWLRDREQDSEVFAQSGFIVMRKASWPQDNEKRACRLVDRNNRPVPALEIKWLGDLSLDGVPVDLKNKEALEQNLPSLVARDVIDLLQKEYRLLVNEEKDEWRKLEPSDIAILVGVNKLAENIARELIKMNVPATLGGGGNVLESEACKSLIWMLQALENPGSISRLKVLAACGWFAIYPDELLTEDQQKLSPRLENLQADVLAWSRLLKERGLGMVLQQLLESPWLQEAGFYQRIDSGRVLTDLRHLYELLCLECPNEMKNATNLLQRLYELQLVDEKDEERFSLRMEKAKGGVRLLTVHRSKGLQFPVVFLPDFWAGKEDSKPPFSYHYQDSDGSWKLRLLLDKKDKDKKRDEHDLAERESLQERLRIFYVALTRARHRLVLYYAPAADEKKGRSPAGIVLCRQKGEGLEATMNLLKEKTDQVSGLIDRLCDGEIIVRTNVLEVRQLDYLSEKETGTFQYEKFDRKFDDSWGGYSFSYFVKRAGSSEPYEGESDEDFQPAEMELSLEKNPSPAGRFWGDLVHRLMEVIDLSSLKGSKEPTPELKKFVEQQMMNQLVFPVESSTQLAQEIVRWVNTPLGGEFGDFCLADLRPGDRLAEIPFLVSLAEVVESERLLTLAAQAIEIPPPEGYPSWEEQFSLLRQGRIAGLLNGKIDLVFRIGGENGRYYLLDYKTNYLGEGAYDRQRLVKAMADEYYFLQLVFYSLALHRFLSEHLPGYRYERNFGGAVYLFLRGLEAGEDGKLSRGVLVERPREKALVAIDKFLRGSECGKKENCI